MVECTRSCTLVHQLQHGQFVQMIHTVDERKSKIALETRPATVASAEAIIGPGFEEPKGKRIIGECYVAESAYALSCFRAGGGCWIKDWRSNRLS